MTVLPKLMIVCIQKQCKDIFLDTFLDIFEKLTVTLEKNNLLSTIKLIARNEGKLTV